jgi:hypothetical protein
MKEEDKKRDNLERAKTIMGKTDPALLSAALSEMMVEADEAEEADVAKVKEAIKGIYDSIPDGRDKNSIVSKAITELSSDIIKKEVKVIKENLASIDKETIIEAAKDYVDIGERCAAPIYCQRCITHGIELCILGCIGHDVTIPRCFVYPIQCAFSLCRSCGLMFLVGPYEYLQEREIDPRIKEQLKEEIIQEVLQRPELSRAMKKMLKKIQDEK